MSCYDSSYLYSNFNHALIILLITMMIISHTSTQEAMSRCTENIFRGASYIYSEIGLMHRFGFGEYEPLMWCRRGSEV